MKKNLSISFNTINDSFMVLKVMGGSLHLPVNQDDKVSDMCENVNDFLTELFNIQGVEEIFEKYGAKFEKV